jgi:autotransporter-associated beta strand protein
VNNNAALNKTGAGTLLLNGSKTGTGALTVSTGVLGGIGTIAGTVTNLATITAADTNSIGTLTLTNLVMASNSTNIWNCNAVTQDVINVTGTLTLPSVATVIVNEDMVGDIGLKPRTLFTFTTGPASGRLPNWVIIGADERTAVRVDGKQVTLFRLGGTMITIR